MNLHFYFEDGQDLEITKHDIRNNSFVDFVSNENEVRIGTACSCELDVDIKNTNKEYSNYKFKNSKCIVHTNDNEKLGVFYVSEVTKTKTTISIKMEDQLKQTDETWLGMSFPCSIFEILTNVCYQCRLNLENTIEDFKNFNLIVKSSEGLEGVSCRTILKYVAEVLGTFCIVNVDGNLEFKWYDFNNIKNTIDYKQTNGFDINEIDTKRDGVLIKNDKNTIQVGDSSCSFIIENNPLLFSLSDNELYEIGMEIWNNTKQMEFTSGSYQLRTIPNEVRAGGVVRIIDEDGNERISIITQITIDNDNSCTIESFGDNDNIENSKSTSTVSSKKEIYTSEISYGRIKNNQHIKTKQGIFTICEKQVSNVSRFTQVNMELSILFKHTPNKFVYFSIYADKIRLKKEIPILCHEGINFFNFSEIVDTSNMISTLYSLKVRVEDGCEIDIEPGDAVMSLKIKGGRIVETQATDQYTHERVGTFRVGDLTFQKLKTGTIIDKLDENEDITLKILNVKYGPWDISKLQNGSVMASIFDDGTLFIKGDNVNEMKSLGSTWGNGNPWYKNRGEITRVLVSNCYNLGAFAFARDYAGTKFTSITIKNVQRIDEQACASITEWHDNAIDYSITFGSNEINTQYFGVGCFANSNLVVNNPQFDYMKMTTIEENEEVHIIPSGPIIEKNAFKGCTGIDGIVYISSLNSVESGAFQGCSNIDLVRIGTISPTIIENSDGTHTIKRTIDFKSTCFKDCSQLSYVMLPGSDGTFLIQQDIKTIEVWDEAFSGINDIIVTCPIDTISWANPYLKFIGNNAFKPNVYGNSRLSLGGSCTIKREDESYIINNLKSTYGFTEVYGYVLVD